MPIPLVTVTGTVLNAAGQPEQGTVTFTPTTGQTDALGDPVIAPITDPSQQVVVAMTGVGEDLDGNGQFTTGLIPTDTPGLSPQGWAYQVGFGLLGLPDNSFTAFIPAHPNPVDLSELVPVTAIAQFGSYLPTTGGTLSGLLILGNGLRIPAGAAAGYVWTSDGAGNGSWQPAPQDKNYTQPFTNSAVIAVAHNLGKYPAVTCIDTANDVIVGDVAYVDLNSLIVTFTAPTSGIVICN